MLVLPIKKKWFDMIVSGEKKEEYREIKPYYNKRLGKVFFGMEITETLLCVLRKFEILPMFIIFRNGYSKQSPQVVCLCRLRVEQGKEEWGAIPGEEYYILDILEILEVSNVK